jgi:hypothetical protein
MNITEVKAVRRGLPFSENSALPLVIPYEWYEEDRGADPKAQKHLLVFWLNDDALVDAPIARLADLLSWLRLTFVANAKSVALPLPRFVVLGPDNSGTLRNMVLEANDNCWNEKTREILSTTHVYSSQAAAADKQLLDGVHSELIQRTEEFLTNAVRGNRKDNAFVVERTLPLDDQIVNALWAEIEKRHPQAKDQVAIISELDTFYARALSRTFLEAPSASKRIIQSYAYIRGIDGKLPSDEKENGDLSKNSGKKAPASSRPTEQTEGINQADDIRRLAERLHKTDDSLYASTGGRIKAVGLLGSDVYDKLELLKALRPALPETLFFTNNLDARLIHSDEWGEAHNLIVASPYGLHLNDEDNYTRFRKVYSEHASLVPSFQSLRVPPFRDSEQTSLFAATLLAFGVRPNLPAAPSIFEVSRDGVKELKSLDDAQNSLFLESIYVALCIATVASLCAWIWFVTGVAPNTRIPTKPRKKCPRFKFWSEAMQVGQFVWERSVVVFAPIQRPALFVQRVSVFVFASSVFAVPLSAIFSGALVGLFYLRNNDLFGGGEPFAWFDGASAWPPIAIVLFAGFLSIHFVLKSQCQLAQNANDLTDRFHLNIKLPTRSSLLRWETPPEFPKKPTFQQRSISASYGVAIELEGVFGDVWRESHQW